MHKIAFSNFNCYSITYHKFINVIYCKSLNKNFLNLSIQNPQSIDKTQLPVNMENKFKTTKVNF